MPPGKITLKDADRLRLEDEARRRERAVLFRSYQNNPVGYAKDILKVGLTAAQEQILISVAANRRTAVKGGHGVGKSFDEAVIACWRYDCWEKSITYITGPTWTAVDRPFQQVAILRRAVGLPGEILQTGFIRDPDRSLRALHYIRTLNAEEGEAVQGEHKAMMTVLIDEAPAVKPFIWKSASHGLMTGPANRIVAFGNPTNEATTFGEVCSDEEWSVLEISALEHPNILAQLECKPVPFPDNDLGLIWLRERMVDGCKIVDGPPTGHAFEYWNLSTITDAINGIPVGRNPDARKATYIPEGDFEARALGRFPTEAFSTVIPKAWLESLPGSLPILPHWIPEIGVDVALKGDDRTVIVVRRGPVVLWITEIRKIDTEEVAGCIIEAARRAGAECGCDPSCIPIRIDITGHLGRGPWQRVLAQGFRFAEGVNSSESAFDRELYVNRRSELWFSSRDRIYTKDVDLSKLPKGQRSTLIRELSAPQYTRNGRGQKVVEPKEVTKKLLKGVSPDYADGFNLAFSPSAPQAAETEIEDDPFDGIRW
jgi:phage terminase large subunit